jgi:tetratricopeptide (TPR) repeat protein
MGMGDFEEASKTFFQLTKRNPDYYKAYLGIAMSMDKLERYSDAIRYYKKFLGLKQFSEDALFARKRINELKEYSPKRKHSLKIV